MVEDTIQLLFVYCHTLVWEQASWEVEGDFYGWGDEFPIWKKRAQNDLVQKTGKKQKKEDWL